ncbi:MAG: hypothetical protein HY006_01600 [Candidatus Sungbacteria bacterium]|nr:hypothetical protein [Candidatus Sungbacteria bacterium]
MPKELNKKLNPVQEIIEKSGNSFHSRVVNLLHTQNWTVLVSPFYSDNFTDKPREIDIIAERKFDVKDDWGKWLGTVNVQLFIECKYIINDTIVFWFDAKDKERAAERAMKDTGVSPSERHIKLLEFHHFSDATVAKLFASSKRPGEEYDVMNKAINQNLNALVYYRNKHNLFPQDQNMRERVLHTIPYPIIVCNSFDNFVRVDMADESNAPQPILEPFELEVNYAYIDKDRNGHNEYFLLDVVSIDKLAEFLLGLEKTDIKTLIEKISWEKRTGSQW